MPRLSAPIAVVVLSLALVSGCTDRSDPTSPLRPSKAQLTATPATLPDAIAQLIAVMYPQEDGQHGGDHQNSDAPVAERWAHVQRALAAGDADQARKLFAGLLKWITEHPDHIATPPSGETRAHIEARLVLYMSMVVFGDPAQPVPAVPQVGADAVVALISPTQAATVITPANKAGIALPAGAVSEPTVLVVYEDSIQKRAPCEGPLDTELCQYPRFYHFDAFPHKRLNTPARVAVCHVTSGDQSPLRDQAHDARLRIAHDKPADPADYTPNSTQTDGIEILPLTPVGDFVLCGNTALGSTDGPHFNNRLVEGGWRLLTRVASAAGSLVTPKNLYAIDQGGGGLILDFSKFAVVDPVPRYARYCPTQTNRTATYAVLDSAIAHAPESNTVVVCDGTWPTDNAHVTRPVTIRSQHPGGATLQQPPGFTDSTHVVIRVDAVPIGAVRLADLGIQFSAIGVRAVGAYDQLTLDSMRFTGPGSAVKGPGAFQANLSSVPTAHVTVTRSSFTQSNLGVIQAEPVAMDTYNSTFTSIGFSGVLYFSAPGYPNHSPSGAVPQRSRIEGNTFVDAGVNGGAILIEAVGENTVRNNHITFTTGGAADAIFINRFYQASATKPIAVSDNVITSYAPTGPAADPASWGDAAGVRIGTSPGVVDTVTHNTMTNVFMAVDESGPGTVLFTNNTVTNTYAFLRKRFAGGIVANRNDITGVTVPFGQAAKTPSGIGPIGALASGSVTCNWWGSAAGPPNVDPAANPGAYLPFATQPIANTAVVCNPNPAAPSLVRVCATTGSSTTPTVAILDAAMQYVADGGTVNICDGTYALANVNLNVKSMTIQGEGPGVPILDAGGANNVFTMGSPTPINVAVTLRRLRLQNAAFNDVTVGQNYGSLLMDRIEFHPMHGVLNPSTGLAYTDGVGVFSATGAGVTVQNSTFDGGDIGVHVNNAANVVVVNNTFSNHLNAAIHAGNGGGVMAANNTISKCGPKWCIGMFGNGSGTFKILNNTISVDFSMGTENAIQLHRATYEVSGNVITGTGGTQAASTRSTWPLNNAIVVSDQSPATVSKNRISGAFTGLGFNNGTFGSGTDNVIDAVGTGINFGGAGAMSISRSDITNYGRSLAANGGATALARCNWWGTTSGPANPQFGLNSSTYTPWAFSAIAGSAVACDPNAAAPVAVRVCSTSGSGPTPTVGTLASAMALVAAGGTVSICDGSYSVANVGLNTKSMTIQGEGPGLPTLDAGGQNSVFSMNSPTPISVNVTLRRLRLQNAAYDDVIVGNNYGTLLIDRVEFHPVHGVVTPPNTLAYSDGLAVNNATGGGVTVQNSTFDGGDIGVHTANASNVVISNNTFSNHLNAAIHSGNGGGVTANNNTITNCGPKWCIGIFNAAGQAGTFTFTNNSITTDIGHPVINGIQADGASYVMDGNTITGVGGTRVPGDASTWPIQYSGIDVGGSAAAQLTRNVIVGAYNGVGLETASGTVTDNTIHDVGSVLNLYNTATSVTRNDFSNYASAFQSVSGSPNSVATCNWWGSTAGPTGVSAVIAPSLYTPWAMTSIAKQSGVTCP